VLGVSEPERQLGVVQKLDPHVGVVGRREAARIYCRREMLNCEMSD
jgi:hypothetical protein